METGGVQMEQRGVAEHDDRSLFSRGKVEETA